MVQLNIVTVGHNEEKNLPKFFSSLGYFDELCKLRIIYCDQWSSDQSLTIAKEYAHETYQHWKKGYCEWSRKRVVDNLLSDGEWLLVLDCDEEITDLLAKEIVATISANNYNIIKILIGYY